MGMNIRDIAKQAGVSPTAVSFVINGKKGVSDETRERIKRILEENGYPGKANSRRKKGDLSVVVVKYGADSYADKDSHELDSYIIASMHAICSDMNIRVFMTVCNPENFREVLSGALKERYSGVILIGTTLGAKQIQWLDSVEIDKPLVVVDNFMMHTNVSSVTTSDREISHIAVGYLHDIGISSVGYLKSAIRMSKFVERGEGFEESVSRLSLKGDPRIPLPPTLGGAYEEMKAWLSRGLALPEAFYADTGIIALGAMKAMQEKGVRVPGDVSIVAGDDLLFGMFSAPPLTAVSSSYEDICKIAIQLVVRGLKEEGVQRGAQHINVRGKLIVRASTRSMEGGTPS